MSQEKRRKLEDGSFWHDAEGRPIQSPQELRVTCQGGLPHLEDRAVQNAVDLYNSKHTDPPFFMQYLALLGRQNDEAATQAEEQSPFDRLKAIAKTEGEDGFFMSSGTKDHYTTRRIKSKNEPLRDRPEDTPLAVVSGGSGSGKTWFMINCKKEKEIAIYVTGADLEKPLESKEFEQALSKRWNEEAWSHVPPNMPYEAFAEDRNNKAKIALWNAIEHCVPSEALALFPKVSERLLIVIDELGTLPNFLRALCAIHKGLDAKLQQHFQIPNACTFIAGGTGADATSLSSVGSYPESYLLCPMPSTKAVWDTLLTKGMQRKKTKQAARTFATVLDQNQTAKQLITNPRMAALIYQAVFKGKFVDFWRVLGDDPQPRAIESILPLFFAQIANEFRKMNGMASTDSATVGKIYRSALAVVLFPDLFPESQGNTSMLRLLVAKYGVLEDQAYWDPNPRAAGHTAIKTSGDGKRLWLPSPRYSMPQAQLQLFRLGYGFQVGATTGEGFEITISQFLEVLLLAGNEIASLKQILVKLGLKPDAVVPEHWNKKLKYTGVEVVQSQIKVEAANLSALAASDPWSASIAKLLGQNTAVVLINYPKAAFADLVVFIPGRAVLLIQAKFYLESTEFPKLAAQSELFKMGIVNDKTLHASFAKTVKADSLPENFISAVFEDELKDHVRRGPLEDHLNSHGTNCQVCQASGIYQKLQRLKSLPVADVPKALLKLAQTDSLVCCFTTTKQNTNLDLPDGVQEFYASKESICPIEFPDRMPQGLSVIDMNFTPTAGLLVDPQVLKK